MQFRKTPANKRETYTYRSVTGEVFEYGSGDVGAENIRLLHAMDDAAVYNNIKNSKPPVEAWQKEIMKKWKEDHPWEEFRNDWNLSMDGLLEIESPEKSIYALKLADMADEKMDPQKEILYEMVSELPEDMQNLFTLYYIQEMSQQEIADRLGVIQSTIGRRLRRLEERLIQMHERKMY